MDNLLQKAWDYESKEGQTIENRPAFHLTPRVGWMNDPNGFSYYNGKYHMFYQYHPYNTNWGPMHWGHAVSTDLLHWEYLPAALAPDQTYDKFGCFSGSAVEMEGGRQLLMYTGVSKKDINDPSSEDVQTQCLAIGDGETYEKYEANPVITGEDVPEGGSKIDFRDPKMWKDEDGNYYCVIGNRPEDGSGQILLYSSQDGLRWEFKQILAQNRNRFGKMWECPDFFEVDGKWVLMVSPQNMLSEGLEHAGGNGTLCVIGSWNKHDTFVEEQNQSIDYGIDFYATQTVLSQDGRRIMIGWMQNWDTCPYRMEDSKWFGQTTLPRELSVRDGKLIQTPIRELNSLHTNTLTHNNVSFSGKKSFDGISGRQIDMEMEIDMAECEKLCLRFAEDEEFYSELMYRLKDQTLELSRQYSGVRRLAAHNSKCAVRTKSGKLKLRLILDQYSAEVFVNDGEQTMTMTYYTRPEATGISFIADGTVSMNITKSDVEI